MVANQRLLRIGELGLGLGQRSRERSDRCDWTAAWLASASRRSKLIGAGFRALGADAMADRLLGVLRHQRLEFGLGLFVLEMGCRVSRKDAGKLRPGIGGAHIDDPDRLDPRLRRLDPEQARGSPLSTQRQNFRSAVTMRC